MQAAACNSLYIGSHPNKQIDAFNIILPIRHYFEQTVTILTFKVYFKQSNRAIDNT